MLILAFDTTQGACSAAISQEGRLLANAFMPMQCGHAEHLLPTIEQVRRQAKISYEDLELIAVTIGPGTFKLYNAVKSVKVELSANPNYYFKDEQGGQLPYMDGVTFLIVTDASTRVALMRTGKIESAYSPLDGTLPTAQALLKTNPDMVLQTIETTRLSPITFQQNDPVWGGEAGKVARQAVGYAIDTRGIGDVLFAGLTSPLPVRVNYYDFMDHQPTWDELDELREEWYGPHMYVYDLSLIHI